MVDSTSMNLFFNSCLYVRVTADIKAKLCGFELARKVEDPSCTLTSEEVCSLPPRWTAPEVFQLMQVTVHSDLW